MGKKKLFMVVNVDWFFISHRLPLALEAIKRGYDVYLATKDSGKRKEIESYGIHFIDVDFERSGKNPFRELAIISRLLTLYRKIRPDIVHHITVKPAIYGSIAARLLNNRNLKVINAISGLGFNFINERKSLSIWVLHKLMDFAFLKSNAKFIFQNPDDKAFYESLGYLSETNWILIKGSGVDTDKYKYVAPPGNERILVVLGARMLKDKGVIEFVEASKLLYNKWSGRAEFRLVGGIDPDNPSFISEEEIQEWLIPQYLTWAGHQSDMMSYYVQADIVCLPSYREGLPKSLVEAMAVGRPIVTTNAPGCKECVIDGYNGYMVEIKDPQQLAAALDKLLSDEELRIKMGNASREYMEGEMGLKTVIDKTFSLYEV